MTDATVPGSGSNGNHNLGIGRSLSCGHTRLFLLSATGYEDGN